MIEHVVIFKWKSDAAPQQIESAISALRTLAAIPGVVAISVGNTVTDRGQGYTTGLVVRLDNYDTLAIYAQHPMHLAVLSDFIIPIKDNIIAIDYVVE